MNNKHQKQLVLLSRNEGKLKSYESCFDLRAWSHDVNVRDRYLREWMKCNMPSCVFPITTTNNLLKSMSCKHFGRVTPRCHPDCKSKKILESICASCQAMKECFKINEKLECFFEEEDLETGHWPCDKCLNALKSIRMFWRVILDRIFKINNIPKSEEICKEHTNTNDCVHNVAKVWQKEILEQAAYVKNLIPSLTSNSFLWRNIKNTKSEVDMFSEVNKLSVADKSTDYDLKAINSRSRNKCHIVDDRASGYAATSTVKLLDIGCDPVNTNINENRKSNMFLKRLQGQLEMQINEVQELKKENITLKSKLRDVNRPRKSFYRSTISNPVCDVNEVLQPFDTSSEETFRTELPKDNNSEVMITVKNYKNEDFKHVCMLQVIHKTNKPKDNFAVEELDSCKKQDPIDLLTKVQQTFGAIVRKELTIANKKHCRTTRQDIKASYGKKSFNTATSCTTLSSSWSRY